MWISLFQVLIVLQAEEGYKLDGLRRDLEGGGISESAENVVEMGGQERGSQPDVGVFHEHVS